MYLNEHVIGEFLEDKIKSGKLKRSDVFITSKVIIFGLRSICLVGPILAPTRLCRMGYRRVAKSAKNRLYRLVFDP